MEHRKPPEYVLEVLGGPSSIKDIVKGLVKKLPKTYIAQLSSLTHL